MTKQNNNNVEQAIEKKPLDVLTLEQLICDAITEHAESRTERYEVYKDRDQGIFKPKFIRVCKTYAYLSSVRRPNAVITVVDKYGEKRFLNAQAYLAPHFLYDLVNYSGRVYFCDEDRENENYITEAIRPTVKEEDVATLERDILSPEDLNSFWRDYNSTTKDPVTLKALNKEAIPVTSLAGIVLKDDRAQEGYVFKQWKGSEATVSKTILEARMVTFDALSMVGRETTMYKIGTLVHRISGIEKIVGGSNGDSEE